MILTVDIGNTNIAIGAFAGEKLAFMARISTVATSTDDEYAIKLVDILRVYSIDRAQIHGAIISSVVPQLNTVMKRAVSLAFSVESLLVGPGIKTGLVIRCDNPASVGSDIIAASVAAHELYGAPTLIVDMGTATKITVLDGGGAFVGLSIMAGVRMGISALASGTAQLPQVSLDAPQSVVGKNTVDCMRSGAIFGNAAMIDGMIERIKMEMGTDFKLVATGGLASAVIPHTAHEIILDEHLVLKGLNLIYRRNRK